MHQAYPSEEEMTSSQDMVVDENSSQDMVFDDKIQDNQKVTLLSDFNINIGFCLSIIL